MSETLTREPSKIGPYHLERLERLLCGRCVNPVSENLLDHVFWSFGFRRRQKTASFDLWDVSNQGILHLYRHSLRNHRQAIVGRVPHTTLCKPDRVRSGSRTSFVYSRLSSRQESRLTDRDAVDSRSHQSTERTDTQTADSEAAEIAVMERVTELAVQVQESRLPMEEAKSALRELAQQMVTEIIANSETRLDNFLNVVEREQSFLRENRQPTAKSTASVIENLLTSATSRQSSRLSDSSAESLAATFLDDLTDSVAMHLEDLLDEQLMLVVGLPDAEDEVLSDSADPVAERDAADQSAA